MLLGFYSGVSGLVYNEQKQGITSSNLSNLDTAGFRRSLVLMRSRDENPYTKRVHSDVRGRVPSFHGVRRTGVYKIYKDTGSLKSTQDPFDIAIPPELKNAFFSVQRADPNDANTYYTRNGTLSIGLADPSNEESAPVLYLGGHIALDEEGRSIEIDPTGGELQVSPGGVVRQGESVVGELPVYRLDKSPDPSIRQSANLQQLLQMGDSLYKVPEGLEREFNPFRLEAGQNGLQKLMAQGMREESNVSPVEELLHMMEASKGFAANATSITTQAQGLTKLFKIIQG